FLSCLRDHRDLHSFPTRPLFRSSMHYPVFLNLRSRPVLVVGGGKVAFSKIPGLLASGARVTVVAPSIDKTVGGAELLPREFRPRSEEHTSELQSRRDLVCRLLLE